MDKKDFITHISTTLQTFHNDFLFRNYSKQLLSKKLKAEFEPSINLDYLWNRILAIITGGCLVLAEDKNDQNSLNSLLDAANILENISESPDYADKLDFNYLRILSALCYDITGYQANAFCITTKIKEYKFDSIHYDVSEDNFIINQVILILRKQIPYASFLLSKENVGNHSIAFYYIIEALDKWYHSILNLAEIDIKPLFEQAYKKTIETGNIYLSQLVLLLKTKIIFYESRSIAYKLQVNISQNYIWKKYVKLLANDNYDKNQIKDIEKRHSIYEFWISQINALDGGLITENENFIVQMPTSAGKTFIAELYLLEYLTKFPDKKTIYVSPFRALSTEKVTELSQHFNKLGYTVSSLQGSYENDDYFNDIFFEETDILILTPEKADLLFRVKSEFFSKISAAVFDEGHIIGDTSSRSAIEEFLIIKFKIKSPDTKLLFISAVMPEINAKKYSEWLSRKENNILSSKIINQDGSFREWEPTRKNIGYFTWSNNTGNIVFPNYLQKPDGTNEDAKISSILKREDFPNYFFNSKTELTAALGYKLADSGNTLIFCGYPDRILKVADKFELIFNSLQNKVSEKFTEDPTRESVYFSSLWYGNDHPITRALKHGIGIHFGDMVEQVRNSVENDFRTNKLSILLCTNTVGQGVNFPIKNLIIDNLSINFIEGIGQIKIEYRDFWNIVGRVGRAEKETEGNIIFVNKTKTDWKNYKEFINKSNIEDSESIIFKFLRLFQLKRINESDFDKTIQLLSETYLIDLIQEEALEDSINKIVNESLFSLLAIKSEIDLTPVKKSFKKTFEYIQDSTTPEQIPVFRKTGLLIKSNKLLLDFIEENQEPIQQAFSFDDYTAFLKLFLIAISKDEGIEEINSEYKIRKLQIVNFVDYFDIIIDWIENKDINNIKRDWKIKDEEFSNFYIFLATGITYLFPWVYSAFVELSAFKLSIKDEDIPEKIKLVSSYLKYGVNTKLSCLSRMLGIKNRNTAIYLEKVSNCYNEKEFLSWIANLSFTQIQSFDLHIIDKDNISDVVLKMNIKSNKLQPTHFEFKIKGTAFNEDFCLNTKEINIGFELTLIRDKYNSFDPFAVLIQYNDKSLGYVPREYSRYIATEIDLNSTEYMAKVKNCNLVDDKYKSIDVIVNKKMFSL